MGLTKTSNLLYAIHYYICDTALLVSLDSRASDGSREGELEDLYEDEDT